MKSRQPAAKWKDEFYWRIFELVRKGWKEKAIAHTLGVNRNTYRGWIEKNPNLQKCIQDAQDPVDERDKGYRTFRDFIYGRLDPNLQGLWDQIEEVDDNENATLESREKLERLLKDKGKRIRQHLFLYALFHSNFLVSEALKKTSLTKVTLAYWIKSDPRFGDLLDEIHVCKKDFFESCLINLCRTGDSSAILFANRTLNRDRGYNDKVEVDIKHTHEHKIDDLQLSIEVRRQILDAMRKARQPAVEQLEYKGDVVDAEFTVIPKDILEREDRESD